MNLPQAALRRPFTVVVIVLALALGSAVAWRRMGKDIFPNLNLPTIYVAQAYGGMDPAQMEGYLVYFFEYHFLYITGIEHVESKSIQGASVMKLQFHPGTDMAQAMAETVAYVNRARAFMPPGTPAPLITRFDAGSAPIGYLVFSSDRHALVEMQDAALNLVRPLLATLPGVSAPPPLGENARTVVVSLKPDRLKSLRMSPDEAVEAMARANVVSPSGNAAMAGKYPMVPVNSVAANIQDLAAAPVRGGRYPAVFARDVADIEEEADIVTCHALINGQRSVFVPITRRANASTLAVAEAVRANVPKFQRALPEGMRVEYRMDRAPAVIQAIRELAWEGLAGALLTGAMTLLFLRSGRSALIVVVSIPASLMAATVALWLCGQGLNLATLGGLTLAVGILVDEGVVCVENISVHRARGGSLARAALEATRETAGPRLLAMLSVFVLFAPAFFLTGTAKALFLPLALAVGFAVAASYLLSSTLVPILAVWMGRGQKVLAAPEPRRKRRGRVFENLIEARTWVAPAFFAASIGIVVLVGMRLGVDIFPRVHSREFQIRLRAAAGTDVEGTEGVLLEALKLVRAEVGPENVEMSLGFVGLHGSSYPINFLYFWDGGTEEGVLQIQLRERAGIDVERLEEPLRDQFARKIPGVTFSFEPADLISRVMAMGSANPIEVAVSGPNPAASRALAEKIRDKLEGIASLRDVQFAQSLDYPTVEVAVDRERAGILGVSMREISRALIPATWSSRFEEPVFWADPKSGIAYQVQTQIPQREMNTLETVGNLTVIEEKNKAVLLRNVARITEGTATSQYDRYNMQRTLTVRANLSGEDLNSSARRVQKAIEELGAPPARVAVALRGQVTALRELREDLEAGMLVAMGAIFLLLAAHFQSIKLTLVAMSTLPAALAGVALSLGLTGATLNSQSLIGTIMALGVAMANAILLVTFAERSRRAGATAAEAAAEGVRSRIRPILMTSLAMSAGMLPAAIGWSDQTGQLAPLARAVIGGLVAATGATLFVLPGLFAWMQQNSHRRGVSLHGEVA